MTVLRCMSLHVLSGNWWKRRYRSIGRRGTMDVSDRQQCVHVLESEFPISDGLDCIEFGTLRRLLDGLRLRHLCHGHRRNCPVPWVPSGSTIYLTNSLGLVLCPTQFLLPGIGTKGLFIVGRLSWFLGSFLYEPSTGACWRLWSAFGSRPVTAQLRCVSSVGFLMALGLDRA